LAARQPVVLEVKTDPEVPPLPPHVTIDQARQFMRTLMEGDPQERNVIVDTAKQVMASVLPGKKES
jgi:pyruvate dehydrogenase (quinone)